MPALKMLQLATTAPPPKASAGGGGGGGGAHAASLRAPGWGALVDELVDRVPRYDMRQRPVASLASLAIGRGGGGEPPPDERLAARLASHLGRSAATAEPLRWTLSPSAASALPTAAAPRTLTLVSNRSAAAAQIEQLVLRAELQLSARAYTHHYEAHGLDAAEMALRLHALRDVVDDYEALVPPSNVNTWLYDG